VKAGRVPAAVEGPSLRARPHAPRMRAAALEARLADHSLVSAVRVVERSGAVGIAVVPNAAGVARLRTRGWLGYVEALLPDVAQREVAWRFVESLPDPADDAALAALLDGPLPNRPRVLDEVAGPGAAMALRLRVPLDLAVCREHFARVPIVPGVVQLSWAAAFGRERLDVAGRFVALEAVKFQHVLQPGVEFDLRLEWRANERRLLLHAASSAGRHAAGRLVYETA
jgi:3-hydroxymyristoyl/3-hydroxydecanoyl-(acyl carrier protein) dehydratase